MTNKHASGCLFVPWDHLTTSTSNLNHISIVDSPFFVGSDLLSRCSSSSPKPLWTVNILNPCFLPTQPLTCCLSPLCMSPSVSWGMLPGLWFELFGAHCRGRGAQLPNHPCAYLLSDWPEEESHWLPVCIIQLLLSSHLFKNTLPFPPSSLPRQCIESTSDFCFFLSHPSKKNNNNLQLISRTWF